MISAVLMDKIPDSFIREWRRDNAIKNPIADVVRVGGAREGCFRQEGGFRQNCFRQENCSRREQMRQ